MDSLNFKVRFEDQFRRFSIPKGNVSYTDLWRMCKYVFSTFVFTDVNCLSWVDEDGDEIVVSSQEELMCALDAMSGGKVFQFKIISCVPKTVPTANRGTSGSSDGATRGPAPNTASHAQVTCDECGISPIVGARFKCTVRHDFDLCSKCEGKVTAQPFPMIKIYDPEQVQYLYPPHHGRWGGRHGRWGRHGGCQFQQSGNPNVNGACGPNECGGPGAPPAGCPGRNGPHHGGPPRWVNNFGRDVADFAVNVSTNTMNALSDVFDGISKAQNGNHRRNGSNCGNANASATNSTSSSSTSTTNTTCAAPTAPTITVTVTTDADNSTAASSGDTTPGITITSNAKDLEEWSDELLQTVLEQSIRDVAVAPASSGGDMSFGSNSNNNSVGTSTVSVKSEVSAVTADAAPASAPAVTSSPCYQVSMVRDVTYPKDSVVPVGSIFRKVWCVKNTGTIAWPFDTCVRVHNDMVCPCDNVMSEVIKSGDNDKYVPILFCDKESKIHVGSVEPGAEATVAITMNVSKKAVAVAKETSTNAGGEGDFIRCVSAFCVATTASTPFKGDLLVMDIIIPDDAACNASCSTLLSTKSSGSTTNTPSGSAKMTEGWQMVTSSSNIFATTKPSDSAIGIASTADAATGNSNSDSAVVTEEVNISDIHRNTHASAADNGNSTASSSANDISDDATNWSSELQTLSDMVSMIFKCLFRC
jgi:hypothetical protein